MEKHFLIDAKVYFFDLDGCICHGDRLASGVLPLLEKLRERGMRYAFLTNNSRLNAAEIGEKLAHLGLNVPPDTIFPVTDVVGVFISDKYGRVAVKPIGSESLARSIAQAGHRIVAWDEPGADVVAVGRDTEFHYGKLQQIAEDIRRGSRLVATNPDLYHPGECGTRIPETGALLAAIEAIARTEAECIGKPEPYMFLYAMKQFGASPENTVMVGDNLQTDILGSIRAGLRSVWITNGSAPEYSAAEWGVERCRPDVTLHTIEELCRIVSAGA